VSQKGKPALTAWVSAAKIADIGYPPWPDFRDGDRISRSRSGASVGRQKVRDESSTLSDSTLGACQVDTFKIGERVVRFGSERASTIWMEPSARELLKIELLVLGMLLLILVLVGIVGALLSWYWRRKRSALTCAALSLVCAGLAILAVWGSRPTPLPRQFVVAGEPPITFGRNLEQSRRPFELQSSQYTVDWSAMLPPSESSCRVRVSLQLATADRNLWSLIDMNLDPMNLDRRHTAGTWYRNTERIYGVEPGRHELVILEDTGCDWSLTLTPGWSDPTPPVVR